MPQGFASRGTAGPDDARASPPHSGRPDIRTIDLWKPYIENERRLIGESRKFTENPFF